MDYYFIYGDDEYSISKQIDTIVSKIKCEYDEVKLDLSDANIGNLLEELKTIPFLCEAKLVYVSNVSYIDIESIYYNDFLDILANPNENIYVIFLGDNKIKKDSKLVKDLEKYTISYCFTNDGSSLDKILDDTLKQAGFKMSVDTKEALLSRVDNAMQLRREIDKLMTYKESEKLITASDVKILVSKNLDANVYDLVNAVVENQKKTAIVIYRDLQVLNMQPIFLVNLLINKFQEMLDVKILVENGYNKDLIATLYNVKSGRAYYMIKNANSVSKAVIIDKLNYLSKLEADIKMGKQDQNLGFELFLLR